MPSAITFVLSALATFTLSYLLCKGDVFTGLRTRLGCYNYGIATYPDGSPMPETALGRWAACPMCMSVFPVSSVILLMILLGLWQIVAWFGIAGASILMFRWRSW